MYWRQFNSALILSLLIFLLPGCSLKAKLSPEEQRQRFGTVGLVSARFTPELKLDVTKGRLLGAAKGTGAGLSAGLAVGLGGAAACAPTNFFAAVCAAAMLAVGAATATVGGLVGGVAGAVNAVPTEEAAKIEANMTKQLDNPMMQDLLRVHVLAAARERTDLDFVVVGEEGPGAPDAKLNYDHLQVRGVDTALETKVNNFGYSGGGGSDPNLKLFMTVSTRLIKIDDGTEFAKFTLRHDTKPRPYSTWLSMSDQEVHDEFTKLYRALSTQIVTRLFLPSEDSQLEPEQGINQGSS